MMCSKPIILVSLLLLGIIYSPVSAAAQEEAKSKFIVTPRIWFSTITESDEDNVSHGAASIPLYGGTLTFGPSFAPNVDLLLTGFVGEGDGDAVRDATLEKGGTHYERTDIELLVRYMFPGRDFGVAAGGRYVKFDTDSIIGTFRSELSAELWLAELGVGMATAISEDGSHRLFANFVFILGHQEFDFKDNQGFSSSGSSQEVGTDVNFGYQFWMTPAANFSARYRAFVLSETNDFDLDKFITVQGPEVSFGYVF